jgi:hypothetical protein
MSEAAAAERTGQISDAERQELEGQERKGLDRNMSQYDQSVWEVLSPGQLRALKRLLRKPEATRPASKPKRASRSGSSLAYGEISALMCRYANDLMSVAGACFVRMSKLAREMPAVRRADNQIELGLQPV